MTALPMTETSPTVAQRSVPQAEQFVGQDADWREQGIQRASKAMFSALKRGDLVLYGEFAKRFDRFFARI